MSRKRSHRKDANHDQVKAELERLGYLFIDTSQTNLGLDAIVVKHGRMVPVEIKDPKSSRKLKLSPKEAKMHQLLKAYGVTVEILTGDNESLDVLREPRRNFYGKEAGE